MNFIVISSLVALAIGCSGLRFLGRQALSGFSVEQMDQAGLGGEPDGLARLEFVALAEIRDDLLAAGVRPMTWISEPVGSTTTISTGKPARRA